jgi:hypothetical protein
MHELRVVALVLCGVERNLIVGVVTQLVSVLFSVLGELHHTELTVHLAFEVAAKIPLGVAHEVSTPRLELLQCDVDHGVLSHAEECIEVVDESIAAIEIEAPAHGESHVVLYQMPPIFMTKRKSSNTLLLLFLK